MTKRRLLAFLLGLLFLIAALASCGSPSTTQSTTQGNATAVQSSASTTAATQAQAITPHTLTVFINNSDTDPVDLSSTPVGKKITELTGYTLKIEYLVGADEKTKGGIMVASGEYPDIVQPCDAGDQFMQAHALITLDDLIDKYGPNIKKAYGNDLKKFKNDTDGKIYGLGGQRLYWQNIYPNGGFYIAKDVLKQAGYPLIRDINQYFQIIKDYAKKNPTYDGKPVIPFDGETESWKIYLVTNVPQQLDGYYNTGDCIIDPKTYVNHNFHLDKSAHDYFSLLNGLWNENYIDKEMFTQNSDAFHAKIASGRVLGFYNERYNLNSTFEAMEKQGIYDRIPFAMPCTWPGVTSTPYNGTQCTTSGGSFSITTSCKDPVAAIKFFDVLCSDDVQKLVNWGIEGVDYTVQDGKMIKNAEQLTQLNDPAYKEQEGVDLWDGFPRPNFGADAKYADGNPVSPRDSAEYISSKYKPYEKEVADAYHLTNLANICDPPYSTPFGRGNDFNIPDSQVAIRDADQKQYDMNNKTIPQLVMAEPGKYEALWNKYVADMKAIPYNLGDDWKTKLIQKRVADWN